MNILELLYWFTGSLGVVFSAGGLRGLCLKQNAVTAWDLTDPIGRLDFHFSEGQFDLIVRHLEQEFSLCAAAIFLLASLIVSAAGGISEGWRIPSLDLWCEVVLRVGTVGASLAAFFLLRHAVHRACIRYSAREVEQRARSRVAKGEPDWDKVIEKLSWFRIRVGRDPDLG